MTVSFLYDSIPENALYECGYFEPKKPFRALSCHNFIQFLSQKEINQETLIVYFPGSFGYFHKGHLSVVRRACENARSKTDNFVVVISPAHSDYSVEKYGDTNFASNKDRYDQIMRYEDQLRDMNVIIDLNPMLNFECDHNFTDFLKFFVDRTLGGFQHLRTKPILIGGKDRDFSALASHTDKVDFWYFDAEQDIGTSTSFRPEPTKRPKLYLRAHNQGEVDTFTCHLGLFYKDIEPIFIPEERKIVTQIAKTQPCMTICKDYADLVPYMKLSRHYEHPLADPYHQKMDTEGNSLEAQLAVYRGFTVIDSDVFSGGTRFFIEGLGLDFVSLTDLSGEENVELLDIDDFKKENFCYPFVDLSSRCSLPAFSSEKYDIIRNLKNDLKLLKNRI